MDTRLKNNHKWGVLLILLSVLGVSAATMGLYPYMTKKAQETRERYGMQREKEWKDFGNLTTQVMNFSYEIWFQQRQEEAGRLLNYSQVFLPGLEEKLHPSSGAEKTRVSYGSDRAFASGEQAVYEDSYKNEAFDEEMMDDGAMYDRSMNGDSMYDGTMDDDDMHVDTMYDEDYYRELQSMMDEVGSSWNEFYRKNVSALSYGLIGPDGSFTRSNVNHPEQYFSEEMDQNELMFTIEFSDSGRLSIYDIAGPSEGASRLLQSMSRFEFYDPIAVRLSTDYRYSGVEFAGPKDMKLVFRCNPMEVNGWSSEAELERTEELDAYDYLNGDGLYLVVLSMVGIIFLLAVCIPFIKSFDIGRSALCRLSFEPLMFIGGAWLVLLAEGEPLGTMPAVFTNGSMHEELLKAGLLDWSASAAQIVIHLAFWSIFYGVFYWGITCLRAIFTMGPWRYFKERTWLGRFLRWIKRLICKGLNLFQETDWESDSTKLIGKAVLINFMILALISCLWFAGIGVLIIYSFGVFFLLKKYWGQMEKKYQTLLDGINEIAEGNLDVEIKEDLGIFNPFKEQLSKIQKGFRKAVDQEVKSERTKSELITNVSHDLKTPLTAIITYVNLLKQENITEEEREAYIQVLDQKSMRLKVLIEDLFEVTKASSGTIVLHMEQVDIVSLLKQVRLELAQKLEDSGIDFRFNLPDERIEVTLDGQKTYRIFENLLVNISKYGMKGTRAYIQILREPDGYVAIIMRNIAANELLVTPEELTERFVRGDESRNTEGSGLGLAIAKSLAEAQGGTMKLEIEDDLFRVTIRWKCTENTILQEPSQGFEKGADQESGAMMIQVHHGDGQMAVATRADTSTFISENRTAGTENIRKTGIGTRIRNWFKKLGRWLMFWKR